MTHISLQVEGIKVHADEGGVTQTRGGVYWLILPAGCNFINLILDYTIILSYLIASICSSSPFREKNERPKSMCVSIILFNDFLTQ